jgi:uncharacterized protein YecT (DUF1311 family)
MIRAALAAVLFLVAVPVFADEACDRKDQSQMGMNACAEADAAAADTELNAAYKQLAAKAEGKEKDALRDAQRAWIVFRDKECDFETIGEEGGSIRPMEISICIAERTKERSTELKHFLACANDDKACEK